MVSPKTNFYLWDKIANNNQDVGGIGILGTNNVSNFDDAFRELMAQLATAFGSNLLAISGDLYGLNTSNNVGDAVNDIDIASGNCASIGASPIIMTLASTLTKRLDAAWAVGTNQGGLDTGAIANAWYHIWLIQRSDTGVVDALFSLSASAPTMPASYDRKRRIGSILRAAGTIVPFMQVGDLFQWLTPVVDRSSTSSFGNTAVPLTVPLGIVTRPIIAQSQVQATAGGAVTGFSSAGTFVVTNIVATIAANERSVSVIDTVTTDLAQNVWMSVSISGGTLTSNTTITRGWFDRRGQDGGL